MSNLLILGVGSEVGKTNICAAISYQISKKYNVRVLKPIISGWDDLNNDIKVLLQALSISYNNYEIDRVTKWKFTNPVSPDIAAKMESRKILFDEVVDFCKTPGPADYTIIEAAGGVMTPINDDKTFLDLAVALDCRVLLVTGSYLGSISHCLTAHLALKSRGINDIKIILNQSENCVGLQDSFDSLNNHGVKVDAVIPRMTGDEPWKSAPDLTHLVM